MILDLVLFPAFALLVSLIGKGFVEASTRITGLPSTRVPAFLLPLLGAFAIGLTAFCVNFVAGSANSFSYAVLSAFFVFGLSSLQAEERRPLAAICLLSALCTPLAADMQPGPDAALYHLPHQKWIREHAIVFGLANLHGRYGFSSFLEYINSLLWIGEAFKLLSYTSALFFVSFLSFLYSSINSQSIFLRMFAILISLNVLVYDGYFVWKYGYTDCAAGISFMLSVALGLYVLDDSHRHSDQTKTLLFAFLTISAMSVALKVSGILIAFWAIAVIAFLLKHRKITLIDLARTAIIPIVFACLWTFRGIVISGCILFPASSSCLDLPWGARAEAAEMSKWITAWARHPNSGLSSLESWSWLTEYWVSNNLDFLLYFGLASVVVITAAFLPKLSLRFEKLPRTTAMALTSLVLLSFGFWFFKAPTERFGIGILMILFPALSVAILGAPKFRAGSGLKILSILLIVLLADNQGGFSLKGLTRFEPLTVPEPKVVSDPNFGVRPADGGGDCWTARYCAPRDRARPTTESGYLFFAPLPL